MKVLVWLCMLFSTLFVLTVLVTCWIFALVVFDFVWDTDLKEQLRLKFGESDILNHLRKKTVRIVEIIDTTPALKERY